MGEALVGQDPICNPATMLDGLSFGWRTAVLTVALVQLLLLALALARTLANRTANRTLALLLLVLALQVTPWLIGFAGFYDKWPWLSFAPFQIGLAVAPLAWLYVVALTEGHWPVHGWRHLLPALVQFGYLGACFALPLATKLAWANRSATGYGLITGLALLVQLAWYGRAAARRFTGYRLALGQHIADDQRFAARWLSVALGVLTLLFAIWSGYLLWDLVAPLSYKGLMGLYLAIAACALFLGIEGWRHAAMPFPRLPSLTTEPAPDQRDWTEQGQAWAAQVRAAGWARDPDLTLASLARRLGTNTGYLSRAINQGLGVNFASFVAGLRAEAVAERLRASDPADLLEIALAEGFGSKASFNRAFVARFGQSPSAFRREVSKPE
ncbi:helix-turn-helix domain-containing protein [Novosphingobium sp.]|uniref:AraC family transcriptional regulator n=1 Tax=Novosphingobium sp. TaxID=1874826 RepID=UPI0025F18484|nr:helix-turn-helix domain-containing protein [Novosphingobium sp.]